MALGVAQAANNTATTATAVTVTVTTSANSLLVVASRQGANNTSTLAITDSAGQTGWLQAGGYVSEGSLDRMGVFYKENSAAVTSVTLTWSGAISVTVPGVVYEVTGAATSSSIDGTPGTSGSTTSITSLTSGALTTTNADDILLYVVGSSINQTSWTAGTSYAIQANGSAARLAIQFQIVAATQSAVTTSMSFSPGGTAAYEGLFAAFSQAAAAGVQATVATLGQFSKDIVPNLCNFDTSMSLLYGAYDDDFVTQFSGTAFATATQVYSVPLGVFSKDAINGGFDPGL